MSHICTRIAIFRLSVKLAVQESNLIITTFGNLENESLYKARLYFSAESFKKCVYAQLVFMSRRLNSVKLRGRERQESKFHKLTKGQTVKKSFVQSTLYAHMLFQMVSSFLVHVGISDQLMTMLLELNVFNEK